MEGAEQPFLENQYHDAAVLEMGVGGSSLPRPSRMTSRSTARLSRRSMAGRVSVRPSVHQRISVMDEDRMTSQAEQGLSSAEAARLQEQWGKNEVVEAEVSILMMFIKQFYGSMPLCILACFILAIVATDYIDVLFIGSLLFINALVGFKEEFEAYEALQSLLDTDVKRCRCKRDGKIYTEISETGDAVGLPVEELVPGDVVAIKIGDVIPADCIILEGSIKMDTKSVTGEPLPWRVPRETPEEGPQPHKPEGYAKDEKGSELWAGCDVTQGECFAKVIRTGPRTIVGEVNQALANKEVARKSDFEQKILLSVKIIITTAVFIAVLMAIIQSTVRGQTTSQSLRALVALMIGSVPVALPLVLLVTMAQGSVIMSNEQAVVSDLAALQDIASMTCLNSDKTGTITTAVMSIIVESIHAEPGFTKEDILELAAVCSNRANRDDAIDGAIIRKWDELKGGEEQGEHALSSTWKLNPAATKGFNNAAKRVECEATRQGQTWMIVKGLIGKVLKNDTDEEEDEDNSHTRFECKDFQQIKDRVSKADEQLAKDGYKTIGVAVRKSPDSPVEFVGIVPMLDPPRADAAICIQMIREAGVNVKMVTGDHRNIAKTTCELVNLGSNILPNTEMQQNSGARLQKLVLEADGFAQVLPKDKETVVLEEKAAGWIVGFCGDGMNDALALNEAQVGIAVADAMEAAIKASAIQLLDPGLQCIYTAIVESRKIFRRVKSYVTYRFAATIQVIVFLSVSLFVSACQIDLIYIVMLALLNDLTMLPLSNDRQKASKTPDNPIVSRLLLQSLVFGLFQAGLSVCWFYVANQGDDNFLYPVEDTEHINPLLWYNYLFSKDGTSGNKAKLYDSCITTICPGYVCKAHNNAALREVSCTYNGVSIHVNGDPTSAPAACQLNTNTAADTRAANFCTRNAAGQFGIYTSATQKIPPFVQCCAEHADLKHPGQPHFGEVESACTEITTVSVFVQILVASEFMIFPVRALSWMWTNRASTSLYISIFVSVIIFSILAALGVPKNFGPLGDVFAQALGWKNTAFAWLWGIGTTFLLDIIKYFWVLNVDGTTEEIEDERVADRMKNMSQQGISASARNTRNTFNAAVARASAAQTASRAGSVAGVPFISNRMTIGNARLPGRGDPASLSKALARSSVARRTVR